MTFETVSFGSAWDRQSGPEPGSDVGRTSACVGELTQRGKSLDLAIFDPRSTAIRLS